VTDHGPGLPTDQQSLLEEGTIAEFDDPTTGFGLNIVRLLVETFDGYIHTTVADRGTTVAVELRRPETATRMSDSHSLSISGVATANIPRVIAAALVAVLVMGTAMQQFSGTVPVIGSLYGVENRLVGWITHEFHSVIFGLVYAALLSTLPRSYTRQILSGIALAIGFGIALWAIAAGVIMPIWLRLVGVDVAVPNLTAISFVGHVVWGVTLGALYYAGNQ
jgi:hypothetical protein